MKTRIYLGLLGALGIWMTAGLALPFVNVLKVFSPEQLMVFRGFITAIMALICLRGSVGKVDKYTLLMAATVPFATLGLFEGIRNWGAGPTIIIIAATPIINFVISLFLGRKVVGVSMAGFALILGGIVIARHGGHFQWSGFAWSVFGTIMNGITYEWLARAKASSLQKCFFGSVGMGILGLLLSIPTSWVATTEPKLMLLLTGFVFVGGFLYWIANILAFENLPLGEASVLAQGETPAVIIGAYFLLGERLTLTQWIGVFISLFGAWYLSYLLATNKKSKSD